jgi:hypothetical protein
MPCRRRAKRTRLMADVRAIKNMNRNLNRPSFVIAAERLLWLSAAIAALFTVAAYVGLLPFPFKVPGVAVVSNVIPVAVLSLCAVKIGVGRNWARWLMLVFFVIGILMLTLAVIIAPQVMLLLPTLIVVFGFIQCVIQLAALVLVFMPASRIWFRPAAQVIA